MLSIQEEFNTSSGNCTIPGTEQLYVSVTVQHECIDEIIDVYRVKVLNASGVCVKRFEVHTVALHDIFYDWRTPYFTLPTGIYTIYTQWVSSCTIYAGVPYAENGKVLQEVAC